MNVPGMSPPAAIKHSVTLIPSADVYNTALASQTDRCFSSPQLGGTASLQSVEMNRPFSSPPSVIVMEGQKTFRNKIGPVGSRSKDISNSSTGAAGPGSAKQTVKFNNPLFDENAVNNNSVASVAVGRYKPRPVSGVNSSEAYRMKPEWGSVGSVIRYSDNNPLIDMRKSQTFSDTESLNSSSGLGVNNPTFASDTHGQFVRVRRSSETIADAASESVGPVKRHRYSSQFSDDFVPYQSASAESILSTHSRIHAGGYKEKVPGMEEAQAKSQSLGSLNNHLTGCDISEGLWEWESEPHSTSRDDLILEDIEDCGSEIFNQKASQLDCTAGQTLMDCDLDDITKTEQTKQHYHLVKQPKHVIGLSAKCTNQSLVCLHEPELVHVKSDQVAREDSHEYRTPTRSDIVRNCPDVIQEAVMSDQDYNPRETSFMSASNDSDGKNTLSITKFKDFFVKNSNITDNKYFMYILGGKSSESQNLHIRPLPVWKLEIDIV